MAQPTFEGPDGKPIVPKVTADGEVRVTGEGGAGLAKEETLATIASTVTSGVPLAGDPKINVGISTAVTLETRPATEFTATATPAADAPAEVVRVAGEVAITGRVAQGAGAAPTAAPWIVASSDGVTAQQIATKAGQDAALEAVDELEADAERAANAQESIDEKTLTPLGTDFATPVRGTATNSATQLPSSSTPRGFALENIDSANDLYVGTDNTVTTANGFKIPPSRSRRFPLGNPDTLWVISATTTAWQIGAVV